MWEKYLAYTPYHYCRNNPINAIDFNGMFDIPKKGELSPINNEKSSNYFITNKLLVEALKQAKDFLVNNPSILNGIQKLTQLSKKDILNDFTFGKGPKVFAEKMNFMGLHKNQGQISVSQGMVNDAEKSNSLGNKEQASREITVVITTVIHEYLHDKGLNEDKISTFEKKVYNVENPNNSGELENAVKNGSIIPIEVK